MYLRHMTFKIALAPLSERLSDSITMHDGMRCDKSDMGAGYTITAGAQPAKAARQGAV
jgi:hypothetical protein